MLFAAAAWRLIYILVQISEFGKIEDWA